MTGHHLTDVTVVANGGSWSPRPASEPSRPQGCRSSSVPASPTFPTSSPRGVTSPPAMTTAWEECSDKVGVARSRDKRQELSEFLVGLERRHRSSSAGPMWRAPDICRISSPSGSKSSPALSCSSLPPPSLPEPVSHPFRWQGHRLTSRCPSAKIPSGDLPQTRRARCPAANAPVAPATRRGFPSPPRSGQRSRSTGRNSRAATSSTVWAVLATHT